MELASSAWFLLDGSWLLQISTVHWPGHAYVIDDFMLGVIYIDHPYETYPNELDLVIVVRGEKEDKYCRLSDGRQNGKCNGAVLAEIFKMFVMMFLAPSERESNIYR